MQITNDLAEKEAKVALEIIHTNLQEDMVSKLRVTKIMFNRRMKKYRKRNRVFVVRKKMKKYTYIKFCMLEVHIPLPKRFWEALLFHKS